MPRTLRAAIFFSLLIAGTASAHVSERALVLLLPTHIYIRSGVIAVALTIALLILLPPAFFNNVFRAVKLAPAPRLDIARWTSLTATALLLFVIYAGFTGSRDPLANPLPVLIWSVWWIAVPVIQAVFGNLWRFINPWTGLLSSRKSKAMIELPEWLGTLPAMITFLAFAIFQVADIAPDDPDRLATIVLAYWAWTLIMALIFGDAWLARCEPFTLYFNWLAKLSCLWRDRDVRIAMPGTRIIDAEPARYLALFLFAALGAGSFDGLNETFWWLAQIGINPLEFPGRSAVIWPNTIGLLVGICALGAVFSSAVWLGLRLVKSQRSFATLLPRLALSLLPIALGYHIAHYLTSFLVGSQYALLVATDPLARGQDLLGIEPFYVTTSFFNVPSTVEMIWLTQAAAIVIGHILAVLVSHAIALNALNSHTKAIVSQLPIAAFMIAYTFFGLWILAQPTGA